MRHPHADRTGRKLRLVLIADPGLPSEIARNLSRRLPEHLRRHIGKGIRWQVDTVTEPLLADEQADVSGLAEIVENRLADRDWDIGVFLTDLPRRAARNPVSTEVDPERRIALISLPALGSRRLPRRVRQTVVGVVRQLTAQDEKPLESPVVGRPAPREESQCERYVVPGLRGHVRLVLGMVRANRPWLLFTSLSRAMAGVFATAAVGFLNSATWQVSTTLGIWQLTVIAALSTLALTAWIIIDHGLWERAEDLPGTHAPLYPYNLVTLLTIGLGVFVLYAALFVTLVALSFLVVPASVFGRISQHAVDASDYVTLSWFVTSSSMIGGAFGTGLENAEEVRDAAYGKRHRRRQRQLTEARARDRDRDG
ncbi:hypothetical protein [Streptomyces sp. NPDC048425]|uniref:hypothetical protein n=1 Tax=Streptomyces sp. NPDC048425 TaxID=3365548 RepID=UPI00371BA176